MDDTTSFIHRPWLKEHSHTSISDNSTVVQKVLSMEGENDWQPKVGKLFDTLEEAWKFWNDYGGKIRFDVRKQYFNKNKDGRISSVRYVCSKEGIRKPDERDHLVTNQRLPTRTDCPVRIGIKYMKEIEKYQIHEFVDEHNHPLHLLETTHMLKSQRKLSDLLRDLKFCMYKYLEEVDFQRAWDKLVHDYKLQESRWISDLYNIKEKWAKCYMKNVFTIGIRSTQLSESFNADLKTCLKPDLDIIQFFKHFDRVVTDKRYNELQCEFDSRQKLPRLKMEHSPLLQQVAQTYTLPIFDLFQKEYDKYSAAYIKEVKEGESTHEYLVGLYCEDEEFKVTFTPSICTISCSCRKFETFGILCCHAINVLDVKDIKLIPTQYILKRWTREAKIGCVKDTYGRNVQEDANLVAHIVIERFALN